MKSEIPVLRKPPRYFAFLRQWNRIGMRGAVFILRRLRARGALEMCAPFPIGGGEHMLIPLYFTTLWEGRSIGEYERAAIDLFATQVVHMRARTVLVDCGADIGIFSRLVLMRAANVQRIIGFEPNPMSCGILRRNLENLRVEAKVYQAAVSDRSGFGRLASLTNSSTYDTHSRYFESDPEGPIEVCTIDDLRIPSDSCLAVKIDVEGGELAVLHGAKESIASARDVVIQLEAHPKVAARTGLDPIECLRFIESIRPCTYTVCERPETKVSLEKDFFTQLKGDSVYNVIATTAR